MEAAGADLEPYWGYWAYHSYTDKAAKFLDKFRIGRLDIPRDHQESLEDIQKEFYASDPARHPALRAFHERPFSSETDARILSESRCTPAEVLYVRNHAPVPEIDPKKFSIDVFAPRGGGDPVAASLSLKELQDETYPRVSVESVLQCAGNRGGEMIRMHREKGTAFVGTPYKDIGVGMIGNAKWGGVLLADAIEAIIPDVKKLVSEDGNQWHVIFEGADGYETSTPLQRILDRSCCAMLADSMNEKPLTPDHGYPVRAFLPGIAGARSVKWLQSIRLSRTESDSPWQKTYYKKGDGKTSIQEMPHTSMILSSKRKRRGWYDRPELVEVKGVAWGGGSGQGISAVEVSGDGGETWIRANLLQNHVSTSLEREKFWGWVQWCATVKPSSFVGDEGSATVMCRSYDGLGECQPRAPYNPKGYLYNGWHSVKIKSM